MTTIIYGKPYRAPIDLIADLKAKKLEFLDEREAEKTLSQISYYHFKIYLHPLIDQSNPSGKHYRPNEYFEYGLELYRFDEKLRALLFSVIARLEVKLRTRLDHTLSSFSTNPFWYLDDTYFYTKYGTADIDWIRAQIHTDFSNEKELYAVSYRTKYHNDTHPGFTQLPPFWIASEIITIGRLFRIFKAIDFSFFKNLPAPQNKILDNLANEFGANDFTTLINWIQRLRDVRNRCAHHSRLWNARLATPTGIANDLTIPQTHNNRPYLTICVMNKMIKSLGLTGINLKREIQDLFRTNHAATLYRKETGFPEAWETDVFWS